MLCKGIISNYILKESRYVKLVDIKFRALKHAVTLEHFLNYHIFHNVLLFKNFLSE